MLVVLLLVFGMAVGVQAESAEDAVFTSGNWRYRVRSDGNLEIAGWNRKESDLVIPAAIDGKKVVAIGDLAFLGCYSLTSITIPDSVTSIGDLAFLGCDSLTSITIPDSVTSIGDSAFWWCRSLTSVTIPDSVTSIGRNPFAGCDALQIDISPDHPTLALIDNALFYKPEKRLVTYLESSKAETYTIPQGILSIGDYAFGDCDSLTSVTIPDSVTSIGDRAFYWCDSLTSITIPDSVTSIGDSAFEDCYSLTSITIPGSVTSIGDDAFFGCPDTLQLIVDRDSYAKEYAKENNLSYNYPDALDWLAP